MINKNIKIVSGILIASASISISNVYADTQGKKVNSQQVH